MELGDDYILDLQSTTVSFFALLFVLLFSNSVMISSRSFPVFQKVFVPFWAHIKCVFAEYWDLMNEDEKSDKIPEVWQGHNIADYIDPSIMRVSRGRWDRRLLQLVTV